MNHEHCLKIKKNKFKKMCKSVKNSQKNYQVLKIIEINSSYEKKLSKIIKNVEKNDKHT